MRLFSRFQKQQQPQLSTTEVEEIQERVRTMRQQVGKRDVELADLFALLGEDERTVLREIKEVKRPELERFWPDQIPTTPPPSTHTEPSGAAVVDLKPFERSPLPTAP
jgi:hypothetical protein